MSEIDAERAKSLMDFREEMYAKLNLPANVAKSDWRDMTTLELLDCIEIEILELESADFPFGEMDEAVDLANYAFMIWDKARKWRVKNAGRSNS